MNNVSMVVIFLRGGGMLNFVVPRDWGHLLVNKIMDSSYVGLPEGGKREVFTLRQNGDKNRTILSVDLGEVVAVQLTTFPRTECNEWRWEV